MTRNQRMLTGAVLLFLLGSTPATLPAIVDRFSQPYVPPSHSEWVVRSGDTLWRIAEAAYPQSVDPRRAVEEIKRANGLRNAVIYPTQRLVLPEVR